MCLVPEKKLKLTRYSPFYLSNVTISRCNYLVPLKINVLCDVSYILVWNHVT